MLEIKNVYKTYASKNGVTHRALENVSLKLNEKGLVFILGKSGSGKSTLLNLIGGLDNFDRGDIIFNGKSFLDFSEKDFDYYRNSCIGFIFQDFNLLNNLTVFDNVSLALDLQSKKDDKLVLKMLEDLEVKHLKNRKTEELSGGQKQRVAIARALIKNPKIILADEPTGSLDSENSDLIIKILQSLSKDRLVVVVTHNKELAYEYGDRIVEIRDGFVLKDYQRNSEAIENKNNSMVSNVAILPIGNKLSQENIDSFNASISEKRKDHYLLIEKDKHRVMSLYPNVKEVISNENNIEGFTPYVDNEKLVEEYGKPISSNIPLGKGIKLGVSNLKKKRIKLFFTILLTILAVLFAGCASNFADYSLSKAVGMSIEKDNGQYINVSSSLGVSDSSYVLQPTEISYLESLNKKLAISYDFPVRYSYGYGNSKADSAMDKDVLINERTMNGFLVCDNIEDYGHNSKNFKIIKQMDNITDELRETGVYISSIIAESIVKYDEYSTTKSFTSISDLVGYNVKFGSDRYTVLGIYDIDEEESLYHHFETLYTKNSSSLQKEYNNISQTILLRLVVNEAFMNRYKTQRQYSPFAYVTKNVDGFEIHNTSTTSDSGSSTTSKGNLYNLDLVDPTTTYTDITYLGSLNDSSFATEINNLKDNQIIVGKNFIRYITGKYYSETNGVPNDECLSLINLWNQQKHSMKFLDNNNSTTNAQTLFALEDVEIVGVVTKNRGDSGMNSVYVKPSVFASIVNYYYRPNSVLIKTSKNDDYASLIQTLYDNGYTINNYAVSYLIKFVSAIEKYSKFISIAALLMFVIVAILLYSFMSNSIKNNSHQIGVLKALGANMKDVAKIFAVEAIYIGIFTIAFGVIGYYFGGLLVNRIITDNLWTFYYPIFLCEFKGVIEISLLTIVVLAIALIIPIFKIKKIKPIDVMNVN